MLFIIIFYAIWIINGLCCFFRSRIKIVEIPSIIFLYLLTVGNSYNGDYAIYARDYGANALDHNSFTMASYDIGFRIIAKIATSLGLDYIGFLCLLLIPCYTILLVVIFKNVHELHTFFFMYYFVLVFYDLNQIRNFVAAIFLTCAVVELIKSHNIKAFLLILTASIFHRIALIYLALFIITPKRIIKTKVYKLIAVPVFLLIIGTLINNNQIPGLKQMLVLFSSDLVASFYTSNKIRMGFLIPLLQLIGDFGVVYISSYYLKINGTYNENQGIIEWTFACLILGLMLSPLLLVDLTYDRIFRNFSFLIYMIISKTLFSFNNKPLLKRTSVTSGFLLYFILVICFGFLWKYGTIIRYGNETNEIFRVLHNNWIFGVELLK